MNKPPIEKVLKILAMKEQANDLYEKIDQEVAKLHQEFGAGRFDYHLEEYPEDLNYTEILFELSMPDDSETITVKSSHNLFSLISDLWEQGEYLKFEIIDNLAALASGASVFKSTAISPLSFASGSLKRQPKSLAAEEQDNATEND